jgi:surface antigen
MRVDRCSRLLATLGLASMLVALPALEAAASSAQRQTARQTATSARAVNPGLQCVPFARQLSGIDITGNAHTWWRQAEGRFARGQTPERGAVLVFRSSGGMRLGHVSVVSEVLGPRHILVDHANWPGPGFPKGRVARGVSMIDVSPNNTWTTVRVEIHGDRDGFGRHYPTFGFVLPRLADGSPLPPLNPITTARATLDERAARAAARPPAYVGRGAELADTIVAEIGDASPAPALARSEPAQRVAPAPAASAPAASPQAASPQAASRLAAARAASAPAPVTYRVAQFTPRPSLVEDDDLLFTAPDRSLR